MSTDMTLFEFEGNDVRIINQNGDSWFVLKDILSSMGSSTRPAIAKSTIEQGLGDEVYDEYPIVDSIGRTQNITIINDAAVTFLVSRSNTETGKRLNRWIHKEVIPSIRKHGGYIAGQNEMSNDELLARAVLHAHSVIEEKNRLIQQHEKAIIDNAPKVGFYDTVTQAPDTYDMSQVAKLVNIKGMGRNKLIDWLRKQKVFRPNTTEPYQHYVNQGYFKIATTHKSGNVYPKTVAYQRGVDFIIRLLRDNGFSV